MCVMFLISTLSFRASLYPLYCSASLSNHLILPLCLCEEACPPAGPGCWDARLKGPRKEHFWTPLVPLVWCSASLCCWVLCQTLQEVHHFRPFQQQCMSLPPSIKSSLPLSASILSWTLERTRWELSLPEHVLFVIRDNWNASLHSCQSRQERQSGELCFKWAESSHWMSTVKVITLSGKKTDDS